MEKNLLISEIDKLRKEKNAVILAHYYQEGEIQDIADFVGDSLALAQNAKNTSADIIVFAGVHFMAETAKIINPSKKVLLPDLLAGCSLAESCPPDEFRKFIDSNPDAIVISYINTSAEIKAMSDIICTSSNAVNVVKSVEGNKKIIFAPDKNLGNYVSSMTGRELIIWNGACHVHEEFSLEKILEIKNKDKKIKIIAHPECKKPILLIADHIGSTSALLKYVKTSKDEIFLVVTESGILHKMKKENPDKEFIAAPPEDSSCSCNDCKFMKLITLKKIYNCLKEEKNEITLNEDIRKKAEKSVLRMLEISE
jgi:quinolinate synthase